MYAPRIGRSQTCQKTARLRRPSEWFRSNMQSWETAINYFLRNGALIQAAAWE
jgi:hypothetical protein